MAAAANTDELVSSTSERNRIRMVNASASWRPGCVTVTPGATLVVVTIAVEVGAVGRLVVVGDDGGA